MKPMSKRDKINFTIIGVFVLLMTIGFIANLYDNYKKDAQIKNAFYSEDYNGLEIKAYDVRFDKDSDTGNVVINVDMQFNNTLDTSFEPDFLLANLGKSISFTPQGDLGDKITGNTSVIGTVVGYTDVKDRANLKNVTLEFFVHDMSTDDSPHAVTIKIPDKYFE